MPNESKASLKEEIDTLKRQLNNANQLNNQLKTRNTHIQNRLSEIVHEKQDLIEENLRYKALELHLKSKEIQDFKIDYNKMKHRVDVTKNLLDEQRNDNIKFNLEIVELNNMKNDLYNIINGLKEDVNDLFELINEKNNKIDTLIDENFLLKDIIKEYQYQSLWKFLKQEKPENLDIYEDKFNDELSEIYE